MTARENKEKAFCLYAYDLLSKDEIAARLGISLSSVERYKRQDKSIGRDWDAVRSASRISEQTTSEQNRRIFNTFLEAVERISNRILKMEEGELDPEKEIGLLSKLADANAKIAKSIRHTDPLPSITATALRVMEIVGELLQGSEAASRELSEKAEEIQLKVLAEFGAHD